MFSPCTVCRAYAISKPQGRRETGSGKEGEGKKKKKKTGKMKEMSKIW